LAASLAYVWLYLATFAAVIGYLSVSPVSVY
jgi:hypothetical protein